MEFLKILFIVLAVIIVLLFSAGYGVFLYVIRSKRVKKPDMRPEAIERAKIRKINNDYLLSQPLEDLSLKTPDGLTLRAYYIPAKKETKRFVIFSHGYHCNGLDEFSHMLKFYNEELSYNCLYPDHRGHGRSDGNYVGFGARDYKDIMLWVKLLIDRFGEDIEIIMHGISMGAATVMLVNSDNPPPQVKLIIEDCGFANAFDEIFYVSQTVIKFKFKLLIRISSLFCKIFAGYYFGESDAIGKMKNSKNPCLFIHGAKDTYVPTSNVYPLYDACPTPKELHIFENSIHAFSYYDEPEKYRAIVKDFISKRIGLDS